MSREQASVGELLLSLDGSELQVVERVRAELNQQLSTDRGGAVLCALVEYYLDSWSSQVVLVLSSIRESHHKLLLEKLNESLNRPGTRLAGLTLLGHLVQKQPPWVHQISRSALLLSLLRCLKTDTDVVVLVTGVLVLITLLPMIPQAAKHHIYDFFDVFGRLVSWSYKTPSHVSVVHLVHLQAGVYSLFHRLYGMFPCNFISYLRLHYSMKENLDAFQEVVKPMLEQVRVHPELVTGTQDYELDPSRWRCYEVHDIMIECSRVSLDPLDSSCEEEVYSTSSSPQPPAGFSTLPYLDLTSSLQMPEADCESGRAILTPTSCCVQADDIVWSPSSLCGFSTPPSEPAASGSALTLSRTTSTSGGKCPPAASVPQETPGVALHPDENSQMMLQRSQSDVITNSCKGIRSIQSHQSHSSTPPLSLLTSTPGRDTSSLSSSPQPPPSSISLCFTPHHPTSSVCQRSADQQLTHHYESLFEMALPQAAVLFIRRKTREMLEKTGGEGGGGEGHSDSASVSPLEALDQIIIHGHDAHERLSRRWSVGKSVELSHFGGKQPSMKTKGPAQADEVQSLRSQLLLVHSQLQYERFKRQQHAIRNRRLLRRVVNATALEEQSVAMKAQLGVQDEEIRCLKLSLETEQERFRKLQQESERRTKDFQTYIRQLLLQQQDEQRRNQRLQSELQECRSGLSHLEAELQKASNRASNAEHQLTQLSLKLSSSERLQQQIILLDQQLVLLREANRALTEQLDGRDDGCTEASMLQCSVTQEYHRLKDSEVLHKQKLEASNHRVVELEVQLAKKDKLILDQKKLLEDTKTQSRAELSACECRYVALRRITQSLQTEMLQLYSQSQPDAHLDARSSDGGGVLPPPQGSHELHAHCSSAGILNGDVDAFSSSPLPLLSCSSSPIDTPLAVGSYLEQRSRQLFGATSHSQNEEDREQEEEGEQQGAGPQSPSLAQEVEEAALDAGSLELEPRSRTPDSVPASEPLGHHADLSLAVRQRRHELSIMDYDELLPEC